LHLLKNRILNLLVFKTFAFVGVFTNKTNLAVGGFSSTFKCSHQSLIFFRRADCDAQTVGATQMMPHVGNKNTSFGRVPFVRWWALVNFTNKKLASEGNTFSTAFNFAQSFGPDCRAPSPFGGCCRSPHSFRLGLGWCNVLSGLAEVKGRLHLVHVLH
jgi:hypothetical protein